MQGTSKGLRLHIGIFGRRNVGKSSLLNSLTRQNVAIVSEIAGTTTDPVEKAMEFQPLGPVMFIDTAGIDDVGALGELRVRRTLQVLERTDVALLVTDDWQEYEDRLLTLFAQKKIPVILVAGKADQRADARLEERAGQAGATTVIRVSSLQGTGLDDLRQALIRLAPDTFIQGPNIVGDLVRPGDLVVLVVPVDMEAPKGRLILPQVQTLRDLLDHDAMGLMVKERELTEALKSLNRTPALVITDSQEFLKVSADTPSHIPLTSFSILFARFKGDLAAMVRGVMAIETLCPGDRVLIAESCTHHPQGEDIGRVKIPRWLEQYVGGKLAFETMAGCDFPADVANYKLIIHCGACMWNRRQMLSRLEVARTARVPMTNYGLTIAYSLGILERALSPFPFALDIYRQARRDDRSLRIPQGKAATGE